MPNRISALAFMLALVAFVGCSRPVSRTASFGTPDNVLSYGVYTTSTLDSGFVVKLSLNQSGTYTKKKFRGSCLLMEYKGGWKCDNEAIDFNLQEIRYRSDCNTEAWQTEKVGKSTRRMLRSVSTNSFEVLDQDDTTSAQWVRFVKH